MTCTPHCFSCCCCCLTSQNWLLAEKFTRISSCNHTHIVCASCERWFMSTNNRRASKAWGRFCVCTWSVRWKLKLRSQAIAGERHNKNKSRRRSDLFLIMCRISDSRGDKRLRLQIYFSVFLSPSHVWRCGMGRLKSIFLSEYISHPATGGKQQHEIARTEKKEVVEKFMDFMCRASREIKPTMQPFCGSAHRISNFFPAYFCLVQTNVTESEKKRSSHNVAQWILKLLRRRKEIYSNFTFFSCFWLAKPVARAQRVRRCHENVFILSPPPHVGRNSLWRGGPHTRCWLHGFSLKAHGLWKLHLRISLMYNFSIVHSLNGSFFSIFASSIALCFGFCLSELQKF